MNRKVFTYLALIVSILAFTFAQAPTAGFAAEPKGPPTPPVPPTGVPTAGPLSPAEIQALPKPALMTKSDAKASFDTAMVRVAKLLGPSMDKKADTAALDAGTSLKDSLRGKQAAALRDAISKHQNGLDVLMAPGKITLAQPTADTKAPTLSDVQNLDTKTKAWKTALDADVAKVLTPAQMQLWLASTAAPRMIAAPNADISASTCGDECAYAYLYAAYAYYYGYYAYLYAAYGYYYGGTYSGYYAYIDAYYAYLYSYYAYYYALYAYYYSDIPDAALSYAYSSAVSELSWHAYLYAYDAYYYYGSYTDYFYYSYIYNYYFEEYSYYDNYYAWYTLHLMVY